MAIDKGNSAGPAVVTARKIDDLPLRRLVGPAMHARTPFAIIDAIAAFIQKHHGHSWTGIHNLGHFSILEVCTAAQTLIVRIGAIEPTEHRQAAHARKSLAFVSPRWCDARIVIITWTPPYARTVSAVRPKRTSLERGIDLPVISVLAISEGIA